MTVAATRTARPARPARRSTRKTTGKSPAKTPAKTPAKSPAKSDVDDVLVARLTALRAERDQLLAETRAAACGDIVDRATNVEASIRLSLLDERMAAIELELAEQQRHPQHEDGVVSVGDTVVLDLGDGPETFVVGSVEHAGAGVDTVTPASPLGRAILGARVGSTVTYVPVPGRSMSATIVAA